MRRYLLIAAILVMSLVYWPALLLVPVALFMPPAILSTCTIFSDDFATDRTGSEYTTVSGSFTVGSGVITTTSAGALIVENTAGTHGHGRATIATKQTTAGGTSRLVGSYVDSSNYLFCELTINGASSNFKLWKKVAGADTQIGSTVTFTGSTGTFYTLGLCWNGATASASIDTKVHGVFGNFTGAGNTAGFGASPNGGTATFDDFVFDNHKTDDATCTKCGDCDFCNSGTIHQQMQAVVTSQNNGTCANCTNVNGTYICDFVGSSTEVTGAVGCTWTCPVSAITCTGAGNSTISILILKQESAFFVCSFGDNGPPIVPSNLDYTVISSGGPRDCGAGLTLTNTASTWNDGRCGVAGSVAITAL